MQALYALIVMYQECCVNYNTAATKKNKKPKQTSDCALFDLWEFKELFPHKFFLFNTQISVVMSSGFPCFLCVCF